LEINRRRQGYRERRKGRGRKKGMKSKG